MIKYDSELLSNAVSHNIFATTTWIDKIAKLGWAAFIFGVDIKKLEKNERTLKNGIDETPKTPIYLALGLAFKGHALSLGPHPKGIPFQEEFLGSLKPWEWLKQEEKILIIDSNIELSVADYYRTEEKGKFYPTIPAKAFRLVEKGPIQGEDVTCLISYGDQHPTKHFSLRYDQRAALIMVTIWGENKIWQFVDR